MPEERLGTPGDADLPAGVPGESRYVDVGDVRLHVIDAGPIDGKPVLLLHGFPEFWYGWHGSVRPLADAGYRVLVPDQRGYNLSDRPAAVSAYRLPAIGGDALSLIDATGREAAAVVGHDWGGGVGWWLAATHPDRVTELVAVNAPHPSVFLRTLRRSWRQRLDSWYAAAFQLPWLPERLAGLRNGALAARGLRDTSRPGTFTETDLDRYREAWGRPGTLRGMINWYRAAARDRPDLDGAEVGVPTLVLWGARDAFLARSMAHESVECCTAGRLKVFDEATHWVHHEEPVRVTEAVADHVAELPPAALE